MIYGSFRCYTCGKLLVTNINGKDYNLHLYCSRCKSEIQIKTPVSPSGWLEINKISNEVLKFLSSLEPEIRKEYLRKLEKEVV